MGVLPYPPDTFLQTVSMGTQYLSCVLAALGLPGDKVPITVETLSVGRVGQTATELNFSLDTSCFLCAGLCTKVQIPPALMTGLHTQASY
jgi:hypothetical protein